MLKSDAENQRIVEIEFDVKSWMKKLPGARVVRPGTCPICEAAGVDRRGRVVLHGHGVRGRAHWGPGEPDEPPHKDKLVQRRYKCQRCEAVIVVRPRGTIRHRRYSGAAIVLALWLWAGEQMGDAEVRRQVGVHPQHGNSRPERWTTLRRWAKAAQAGGLWRSVLGSSDWTLRACAERAARVVGALADPVLTDPRRRAFVGAAHAR